MEEVVSIDHILIDLFSRELSSEGDIGSCGALLGYLSRVNVWQPLFDTIKEDGLYELGIEGIEEGG